MRVVMAVVEYPIATPLEDAEVVVLGDDPLAYGNLLADLWEAGRDFLLVEQDVLVTPAVRDALERCERPYCQAPYNLRDGRGLGGSLGCVRFTAALSEKYAGVAAPWRSVAWDVLDGAVDATMRDVLHLAPHVHWDDAVVHLHTGAGDRPTDDPYVIVAGESDGILRYRDLRDGREWKEEA